MALPTRVSAALALVLAAAGAAPPEGCAAAAEDRRERRGGAAAGGGPQRAGKIGCPIAFADFGDDGCCPVTTFVGPPETCVEPTCENILQYNCNITSGGSPTCTDGGELPAGASIGITIGGNAVTPTVLQTCTLDGKSCYKYSVNAVGIQIGGSTYSPDCNY
ncbi:unnamed protein product [Prorocentrum cordatum]|uniref:Uncharacterized protein n=1 Tax=Prorocentrum cordatum TaxID=2364126 RepID=A0ABN9RGB3_9DINO|nr:unnamed protein product [Polarella glacialis]